MSVHTYRQDTRIVLTGWVKVADWRSELRHYELSLAVADALLAKLTASDNELQLSAQEVLDLLTGKGQIAVRAAMGGDSDKIKRTFAALTKAAWEYDAPFSVDDVSHAKGDEYAAEFSAAYPVLADDLD